MYRVGIGYDIHRFGPKRRLVLGGVDIPFSKGLRGHSDADIVLHALCDALLGSTGLGDIGLHFPPGDSAYKNISSLKLLEKVVVLLHKKGFSVVNVDCMVILEKPKIAPYIAVMKRRIGRILKINETCVGIKATTNEGVGSIGSLEAAAAHVVVLVCRRKRNK